VKDLKLIVNIHGFASDNASEAAVEEALKAADSERIRNLIESAVLDVLDAECVNPGVLDVLVSKVDN
jgi:hypothetical protein